MESEKKTAGRPKGSLDSKPRRKKLNKAARSAAAKKAAETRRRLKEEKIAGLQTGDQVKPANADFEALLDQGKTKIETPEPRKGFHSEGHADGGSLGLVPSDIAEWIGWPFMLWANHNDLADLCLTEEEKLSLAEPLCRIANRHNIDQFVNPDILDGITAAGRLTPVMVRRLAMIAAERKRRAAQGSAADSQAAPGDGPQGAATPDEVTK